MRLIPGVLERQGGAHWSGRCARRVRLSTDRRRQTRRCEEDARREIRAPSLHPTIAMSLHPMVEDTALDQPKSASTKKAGSYRNIFTGRFVSRGRVALGALYWLA